MFVYLPKFLMTFFLVIDLFQVLIWYFCPGKMFVYLQKFLMTFFLVIDFFHVLIWYFCPKFFFFSVSQKISAITQTNFHLSPCEFLMTFFLVVDLFQVLISSF